MSDETLDLFDDRAASYADAARRWMDEHPEAMRLFERLAARAADSGRRFGSGSGGNT